MRTKFNIEGEILSTRSPILDAFEGYRNNDNFCILMTFNNPLKVCFMKKKYLITIQTPPTQIVISI